MTVPFVRRRRLLSAAATLAFVCLSATAAQAQVTRWQGEGVPANLRTVFAAMLQAKPGI